MSNGTQKGTEFPLKSGERSKITHVVPVLHIRLPIDPREAQSKDDKFTLTSSDGSYKEEMTIKDDKVDGDAFVDLIFCNLKQSLSYTLGVDPGAEGSPYKIFENVPFNDLIEYYSLLEQGDTLEGEPEEKADNSEETDWEDEGGGSGEWGGDAEFIEESTDWEADDPDENEEEIDWNNFDPASQS